MTGLFMQSRRAAPGLLVAIALFCMVGGPATVVSQETSPTEVRQLFARANEEFKKQDYAAARHIYGRIIDNEIDSPALFYNMGTACARLGRAGEAVLFLEKARERSPRDPDILANLKQASPPGNEPDHFILTVPFFRVLNHFSVREWIAGFLVFYFVTGFAGAVAFAAPRTGFSRHLRRAFITASIITAAVGVFAATSYYRHHHVQHCIVMKQAVPIYSGPDAKFSKLVSAPEGMKVKRMPFNDPVWAQVELMSGQHGFVRVNDIAHI
jgi:hypothetical protein